jgi:hypothetical protein
MEADIRELYDSDPRPTFVVDCQAERTTIYHVNTALLAIPQIALSLHSHNAPRDWWQVHATNTRRYPTNILIVSTIYTIAPIYKKKVQQRPYFCLLAYSKQFTTLLFVLTSWAGDPASRVTGRDQDEFRHGRYRWMKFTACKRWLIVNIVEQPLPTVEQFGHLQEPVHLSREASPLLKKQPDTIFTVNIQSPELREHIQRVREVDWSNTSLGPLSNWSYELNVLVATLMLETRPTALFLGPERTILYNLAYGAVSGSRHPAILGKSIFDAWYVHHTYV